tara:strand:+ start:9385 stop:10428 length:1044 start_codon:yes stop_codon:yes gene_type:complete
MATLRINGYTVPVAIDTLTIANKEIGETRQSYDGTSVSVRMNRKRTISFSTPPLSEQDAKALEGLVRGDGDHWSFDGTTSGSISDGRFPAYLNTVKGFLPLTVGTSTNKETTNVKFGSGSLDPHTTLTYPTEILSGMTDLTINAWISNASANPAGHDDYILIAEDASNNNVIRLMRGDSANDIQFFTRSNSGSSGTITYSTNPWTGLGNFHMVTAVLRHNPEGSEKYKEIYFNGSSVASTGAPSTSAPTLSNITTFKVGNNGDADSTWPGFIDELMVVPYAATSSIVSAWYGMGKSMSSLPKVYVDGDVIQDDTLTTEFIGHITEVQYVFTGSSNNTQILSIILEEV